MDEVYNLYMVKPYKSCYSGMAIISAYNAEDANDIIDEFQRDDKNNVCDSYGYSRVDEEDRLYEAFGTQRGIIEYGIYYTG